MAGDIHREPRSPTGVVVGGKDGVAGTWSVGSCELCPGAGLAL